MKRLWQSIVYPGCGETLREDDVKYIVVLNGLAFVAMPAEKQSPDHIADPFDAATILFAEIANFTPISARTSATEIGELLNDVFGEFDQLADAQGLEKSKTIGKGKMETYALSERA